MRHDGIEAAEVAECAATESKVLEESVDGGGGEVDSQGLVGL